jgi:hypothetical protein
LRYPALLALIYVGALSSCEFGETVIPESEPMVVVHGVLRPDLDRQWILIEQTLTGVDDNFLAGGAIPGSPPQLPVIGAAASVTNLTMANDPCAITDFSETPDTSDLPLAAGLYWGSPGCPTMRTGDTLSLRIETLDGQVVTGTTEVPGAAAMTLRVGDNTVTLPGPPLEMNRDADTLEARITVESGRALHLEVRRPDSAGTSRSVFRFFVDTTEVMLPGNLPNFLEGLLGEEDTTAQEDAGPIFTAGRYYTVTVGLGDERYFDFIRSANIPVSGRGFINNLTGGMGVFGSLVAETDTLKVVGNRDDEREGFYRMVGTVEGAEVDVTLELYVAATGEDTTDLSAFLTGDWVFGGIDTSADGVFRGDSLKLSFYQSLPLLIETSFSYLVLSSAISGGMFAGDVRDRDLDVVGSVTLTKIPQPATAPVDRRYVAVLRPGGIN